MFKKVALSVFLIPLWLASLVYMNILWLNPFGGPDPWYSYVLMAAAFIVQILTVWAVHTVIGKNWFILICHIVYTLILFFYISNLFFGIAVPMDIPLLFIECICLNIAALVICNLLFKKSESQEGLEE